MTGEKIRVTVELAEKFGEHVSDGLGRYVGQPDKQDIAFVQTDRTCPYCHGRLEEPRAAVYRIVRMLRTLPDGKREALAQLVPGTHQPLRCPTCKDMFTMLK